MANPSIPTSGPPGDALREALVTLRRPKGKSPQLLTKQAVETLVGQVQEETGLQGEVAGVLGTLRSFRVRAPVRFLKALAKAPTVAKVQAYETSGSAKIDPIDRRPVDLPD